MVRTVKVFVERKTFSVRLEGEHGGTWCSITEHSRGFAFVLGFEKEAVGWMIEHLPKAIEMKSHLGFNRKFRGKCCAHLMEVGFNDHGRFIRISKFANNRKYSYLIIPEGDEGRGWENIKSALSSMLVVPSSNAVEKRRQYRWESLSHNHVGPLHRSFAKVVSGEGSRGGGLVPVGRWARAVVGRVVARKLRKKGIVTIVPFLDGKGVFFVEITEEALFLQDLRNLQVEGRNSVQMRRWSPKENAEIEGKFRGGWIELRGLPFYLWSEVHLKKIVEQWGTVTEIDWRTLKLFDLSKARVRIAMKERSVLPALLEVTDGDWVFIVAVVVVGEENVRRGKVKGESTREALASNMGTGGGRRVEKFRSTIGKRCHVGEDDRTRKGGERGMAVVLAEGTHSKGEQVQSSPSLNSNKTDDGPVEEKGAGGVRAGGDEASAVEGCRAYERKAQSLSKIGPTLSKSDCKLKGPLGMGLSPGEKDPIEPEASTGIGNDSPTAGKGKIASGYGHEAQTSSPAKKKTTIGSKKLWSILLPSSSARRQGLRCNSEPLLSEKDKANIDENSEVVALVADYLVERGSSASPLFSCQYPRLRMNRLGERASTSKNEATLHNFYSDENKEGFLGRVGSDPRGSAIMVLPSTPKIRGKGLRFMGNCGLLVAENLEVTPSSSFQSPSSYFPPSCGFNSSFLSPSTPILPSPDIQSLNSLENRVNSKFFFKKDNDGTVGQFSVGIPNLVLEMNQTAYPNQLTESVNPLMPKTISDTVSQGVSTGFPSGEFKIKGISPRKMEKVREVLKSLDIKVYSRRKSRCSKGLCEELELVWRIRVRVFNP
ncbi:hypothetical protein PVL29_012220 [Vitis rotundifolia]|uniref:DUF4283 domain-containing protein n=1 Tax=Vitis rotundifolia TaxID=103349 RepID=A0AA39DTA3_VITRO|nr:hypothetical protein PVL29_012220 [Vitis rotundifolia]